MKNTLAESEICLKWKELYASSPNWASPKTPTEIRQFLGVAGYYRRFIEGFSKIAKSMTKTTQKGCVKFDGAITRSLFTVEAGICAVHQSGLPEGTNIFISNFEA
ncbi:hypothetical protein Tco_0522666 [Tanacetum coccineum]